MFVFVCLVVHLFILFIFFNAGLVFSFLVALVAYSSPYSNQVGLYLVWKFFFFSCCFTMYVQLCNEVFA